MPVVAVTGLGRGENPQPGHAVIASLRRRWPDIRVAGLVYDALESGIYAPGHPDQAFTLPYPSCGAREFLARIDDVRRDFAFEILVPTLDAEMEPLLAVAGALEERGIRALLPESSSFKSRRKENLSALAECAGVAAPKTSRVWNALEAASQAIVLGGSVMVKGPYYEACRAESPMMARAHAGRLLARWGGPILVQEVVEGDEFDVLAVGDGRGGAVGSCAVRKLVVSASGKGYAGMTVVDGDLSRAAGALLRALRWRGPVEFEFVRRRDGVYHLIEINPRFPAWADFPAAIGCNLVAAAIDQVLGKEPAPMPDVPAGRLFLRHNVDIVCDTEEFSTLAAEGRLICNERNLLIV